MNEKTQAIPGTGLSVNQLAAPLVTRLLAQADELGLLVDGYRKVEFDARQLRHQ